MTEKYQFDKLDVSILQLLQQDARMPYLEMARKLIVSGGTIHQRIDKLKKAGVLLGHKVNINHKKLGNKVTTFLGKFDEVVEAFYTTGNYALMIKVITRDIDHFHQFLVKKLQVIKEIQSTESFICLDNPINRDLLIKHNNIK